MKPFSMGRFELLLRRLVEEPFSWLAADIPDTAGLAAYVWRMIQDAPDGTAVPDGVVVSVSPEQYEALASTAADFAAQVSEHISLLMQTEDVGSCTIQVLIRPDSSLTGRRIAVSFLRENAETGPRTELLQNADHQANLDALRVVDAFLIVQGRQHIALDRPVTRLGRRADNDIVLDSASVSRLHAQIRWRRPHFVLYNVSSRGRTVVNGIQVEEQLLRPGDVIALSDVLLVYGEGRDRDSSALLYDDAEAGDTVLKPFE